MKYEANTSNYERSKIDKLNTKNIKSPNVSKMYGIRIDKLRITYFYKTKKKRDKRLKSLITEDPSVDYTLIK